MPNFFVFGPTFSFFATAVAVGALVARGVGSAAAAQEVLESAAASEICNNSNNSAECESTSTSYVCIDSRCMCNPMWGHTGADCSDRSWTSWAMAVVLVLVILYKAHVLHAAAKKGLLSSTKMFSGFAELASLFFMVKRENGEDSRHRPFTALYMSKYIDIFDCTSKSFEPKTRVLSRRGY